MRKEKESTLETIKVIGALRTIDKSLDFATLSDAELSKISQILKKLTQKTEQQELEQVLQSDWAKELIQLKSQIAGLYQSFKRHRTIHLEKDLTLLDQLNNLCISLLDTPGFCELFGTKSKLLNHNLESTQIKTRQTIINLNHLSLAMFKKNSRSEEMQFEGDLFVLKEELNNLVKEIIVYLQKNNKIIFST